MSDSSELDIESEELHPKICDGKLEIKRDGRKEKEVYWILPSYSDLSKNRLYESPAFTFLGVRWYLTFDPTFKGMKNHVGLHLTMDKVGVTYNIMCTFGKKSYDGSVAGSLSLKHFFCDDSLKLVVDRFFHREDLWEVEDELMENLTITCNLKQLLHPLSLTGLNLLSENIKNLFTNEEFCDVTLCVKDKKFKVHKIILAARSPQFADYFKTAEKPCVEINIPDCHPDSFPEFLEYLYSGKLENISFRSALQLYKTADNYKVQELKTFCTEHMVHNLNLGNFFEVLCLADEHDDKNLFAAVQDFFNRNLHKIFSTSKWQNLMQSEFDLANKLLLDMSMDVQISAKRRKL